MAFNFTQTCASCGAMLNFRLGDSAAMICPKCRSFVHRSVSVASVPKAAPVPEDMSVIRIGTTGTLEGKAFEIIGRIRYNYRRSFRNKWLMSFADGSSRYLMEGLGVYAVMELENVNFSSSKVAQFKPKVEAEFPGDKILYVEELEKVLEIHFDGELMSVSHETPDFLTIYFTNNDLQCALMQIYSRTENEMFTGRLIEFEKFNFKNLRISGDQNKIYQGSLPAPLKLTCTRCSAEFQLFTHDQAKVCACPQCHAYFEYKKKTATFSEQQKRPEDVADPVLPVGSQGKLRDTFYIVTGYAVKKDAKYNYHWVEYTLWNPVFGYAYLAEYNGHWNYLYQVDYFPRVVLKKDFVYTQERLFRVYNVYKAKTLYTEGEFSFDLYDADGTSYQEYISPPYMLTRELTHDELGWYLGEYIEPSEIKEAFDVKTEFPSKVGIGSSQPLRLSFNPKTLNLVTFIMIAFVTLIQIIFVYSARNETIFQQRLSSVPDSIGQLKPVVSPTFTLQGGKSNLEFAMYSPVDNNWYEAGVELVDESNGATVEFSKAIEFYSGYDDGPWTEGQKNEEVILSSIPAGNYHFVLYPSVGSGFPPLDLILKRDVPVWSNYFMTIAALILLPLIQRWRLNRFERSRWMESDFSPYE
ncbi:MAG TPA: DUF4178 domain-containing protein [Bacteroidia bacterium]|nr:DUF4178 domain-containing protein [Bacteroidia bacterium]HNP97578.1 DUF4178 domain-containing protein [Bacteroidia bacterium]